MRVRRPYEGSGRARVEGSARSRGERSLIIGFCLFAPTICPTEQRATFMRTLFNNRQQYTVINNPSKFAANAYVCSSIHGVVHWGTGNEFSSVPAPKTVRAVPYRTYKVLWSRIGASCLCCDDVRVVGSTCGCIISDGNMHKMLPRMWLFALLGVFFGGISLDCLLVSSRRRRSEQHRREVLLLSSVEGRAEHAFPRFSPLLRRDTGGSHLLPLTAKNRHNFGGK